MRPIDWRVHVALLFVQITFGAFHVLAKYAIGFIPPLAMAAMRVLVSAPLLLLLAYRLEKTRPKGKDFLTLALLGFLGVFANQVLYILGLRSTTAINGAILMPSIPVFAAALAVLLRVEKPSALRLFGVALSTVGALVMLDVGRFSLSGDALLGNGLILLNCLSYALYLVLQRPVLLRLRPLTVVSWSFVFGGLATLAVSLPDLLSIRPSQVPEGVWWSLLYIVLVPSGVNYALNTWSLHRSSPALVATYTTLQPLAAALLAIPLLGEGLSLREGLGFLLIVAGLAFVSRAGGGREPGSRGGGEPGNDGKRGSSPCESPEMELPRTSGKEGRT